MSIGLFRRPYVVRRYERQSINRGYASAPYTDLTTRLNVQPLSTDEMLALPEGERAVKRIKSFGADRLTSADEFRQVPGDRLYYFGQWYECKSSVMWNHTMLGHYRSEFVLLPANGQEEPPEVTP